MEHLERQESAKQQCTWRNWPKHNTNWERPTRKSSLSVVYFRGMTAVYEAIGLWIKEQFGKLKTCTTHRGGPNQFWHDIPEVHHVLLSSYIFILHSWNPKWPPCFDWSLGLVFGGLTFKNGGQMGSRFKHTIWVLFIFTALEQQPG